MAMEDDDGAEAAATAGDALEKSLLRAVASVEAELERVMRKGQDDADRLAATIAEAFAKVALDTVFGPPPQREDSSDGLAGSLNQIASAIAKAARRGARFT